MAHSRPAEKHKNSNNGENNSSEELRLSVIGPDNPELLVEDDTNLNIIDDLVRVRPTVEAPETPLTKLQISLMLLRFQLANLTGNARNPLLSQPWREALDWGIINPSRDGGIGLYYLFSSDWNDVLQRLRSEGRGHAGLGILVGTAKVLAATVPPLLIGLALGSLLAYNAAEIAAGPVWLQVLTSPPVSRIVASVISPLVYFGTRKLINRLFPAPKFEFNQTPSLNIFQRIGLLGFRVYDATVNFELVRILMYGFGGGMATHSAYFPAGVIVMDQLLTNIVDSTAFGRHTFDTEFPFQQDIDEKRRQERMNIADLDEDFLLPSYEDMMREQQQAQSDARWDTAKVMAWYAARMALVIATGIAVNHLFHQAIPDFETMGDTARIALTSLIAAAGVLVERLMEDGIPWLYHHGRETLSTCWSRFFSSDHSHDETETESLLANDSLEQDLESVANEGLLAQGMGYVSSYMPSVGTLFSRSSSHNDNSEEEYSNTPSRYERGKRYVSSLFYGNTNSEEHYNNQTPSDLVHNV